MKEALLAASWVARVVHAEVRGAGDGVAALGAIAGAEEVRVGSRAAVLYNLSRQLRESLLRRKR
eukprot:7388392-Prymnesium_polylepis.1